MKNRATFLLIIVLISITIYTCKKVEKPQERPTYVYKSKPYRIEIIIDSTEVSPWSSIDVKAKVFDSLGAEMTNQIISWQLSDSTIASITPAGRLTTNLLGEVKISASVDTIMKTIPLKIRIVDSYLLGKNVSIDSLGEAAETSVTLNPKNPLNLSASANWINYSSFDGGKTWLRNNFGSSGQAMADPNILFDHDGTLYRQAMSWDGGPRGIVIQRSLDGGKTFPADQSFWAYRPSTGKGNADQGIMTIDTSSTSKYKGSVYVVLSDYPSSTPNYNQTGFSLLVLTSRDGGKTWLPPKDISTCTNCGQEHSSAITTGPNGEVYASWWNGKNEIVFNKSTDGGITWSNEKVVRTYKARSLPYALTDDVRGNINIEVDKSNSKFRGYVYISAIDQNNELAGAADCWIVSSSNQGASWSSPVFISDGPKGPFKYYFQPKIAIAPNGRVDAVWYDTRNWLGNDINNVKYDVYYSNSVDGGRTFSPNIRISNTSYTKITNCPSQTPCGQRSLYEYIGLVSDNNRVMPVWTGIINGKSKPYFSVLWLK